MPVDPQRVQAVFLAAVDAADPAARLAILDQQCADDSLLRRRVEALLSAHDNPDGYLDRPAVQPGQTSNSSSKSDAAGSELPPTNLQDPHSRPGVTIAGRFRLLEAIGEGGMGTVWMAEQRAPVKRLVALKLIKPGMASPTVLARFEAERQALALMDHPNIAKVLDGGTTEDGRPYFVMELVRGIPLTQYCDERRLPIPARLDLFMQVCQAVQHAHQKGIIHRDIKPTNILVTEHDGQPVPKVIDFGLAKALQGSHVLTEQTLYTAFGAMVGTPIYMAPEQVGINALDVDTRSDVYALGVILYELLTGSTPLERQRFKEAAWDEVCRLIRDEEAPRPSTRLSTSRALASIAASRHTEPEKLGRLVRGDLDWIVLKALEKDRNRRYETANSLAQDIQRYLANEPVTARSPTAAYRFQKLIRRNKLAVAATAAVAATLLIGTIVSAYFAIQSSHRAEEAQHSADVAQAETKRANENARQAADEREAAQQNLQRSLYNQARVVQGSAQSGRRWEVLELLRQAEALRTHRPPSLPPGPLGKPSQLPTQAELRSVAISALLTPDARAVREIQLSTVGFGRSLSPDGRLAAGAWMKFDLGPTAKDGFKAPSGGLRLVDVASGRELGQHAWNMTSGAPKFFSPQGLALSADGKLLAFMGPLSVGNKRIGCQVHFWELPDFQLQTRVLEFRDEEDAQDLSVAAAMMSSRLAFSPDGRRLAGFMNGEHVIWDLQSGQSKRLHRGSNRGNPSEPAMTAASFFLTPGSFSANGKQLAVQTGEKKVSVWNLDTAEPALEIDLPQPCLGGVTLSPSEPLLAAVCGGLLDKKRTVIVWDVVKNVERMRWEIDSGTANANGVVADFDPEGKRLAVSEGQGISVYDLPAGKRSLHLDSSDSLAVAELQWKADGRHLISIGMDGTLKLWELSSALPQSELSMGAEPIGQFAFSPDGKWVAANSTDGKAARLIDRATGQVRRELHAGGTVVFRADSQQVGIVSLPTGTDKFKGSMRGGLDYLMEDLKSTQGVFLQTAGSGTVVAIEDVGTGQEVARRTIPGMGVSAAFNQGGELLIGVIDTKANTAAVWNINSNQIVWKPPAGFNAAGMPCVSHDGKLVALTIMTPARSNALGVWNCGLWDLSSSQQVAQLDQAGFTPVLQLSPDSRLAATVSMNLAGFFTMFNNEASQPDKSGPRAGAMTLTLWSLPTKDKRMTIDCPEVPSSGFAFSPDSRRLAVGLGGGDVRLWSTESGEEVFRFKPPKGSIQNLTFTPDGQHLAWIGDSRTEIELLDLSALRQQLTEIGLAW